MSNSLNHHIENPRPFHRPVYINASSQIVVDSVQYFLYLDIGKNLKIRDIGYRIDGEGPFRGEFSYFLERIEGKKIFEIPSILMPELAKQNFISLPLNMFISAVSHFYGEEQGFEKISGLDKEELLCRCYGVTTTQIEQLILEDTSIEIPHIMQKTEATSGCGSCRHSVAKFIQSARDRLQIVPGYLVGEARQRFDIKGKRVLVGGILPFELLPLIDKNLKELEQNFEIYQLEGYYLTLKSDHPSTNISGEFIEKYLFEKMKINFQVVFV